MRTSVWMFQYDSGCALSRALWHFGESVAGSMRIGLTGQPIRYANWDPIRDQFLQLPGQFLQNRQPMAPLMGMPRVSVEIRGNAGEATRLQVKPKGRLQADHCAPKECCCDYRGASESVVGAGSAETFHPDSAIVRFNSSAHPPAALLIIAATVR